jgi:glucose-6-phosphate isomerase, archaeal
MHDLEAISGVPMGLDDTGQLVFGSDVVIDETKVRLFDELTPVALEPETCRGNQGIAYYMYNGVYLKSDADRLSAVPMRYELTLMPPHHMGRELVKTFGHRHCLEPESGMDYTEVCEVVVGTARFVFQTLDVSGPSASLALYVEAKAGQKVLAPPGFEHCTINPGPGPLLFSDVIAVGVSGIYKHVAASQGAAYLGVMKDGKPEFIPNPNYTTVPPLKRVEPTDYPKYHLYTALMEGHWKHWGFLSDPRKFWPAFPELKPAFGLFGL